MWVKLGWSLPELLYTFLLLYDKAMILLYDKATSAA